MAPINILVAPGAFKHSLSASQAAEHIARGLARSGLDASITCLPIADGGNGTLDAFLMSGGRRISVAAIDPLGRPIQADYGLLDDGETAVIEMALASGLELVADVPLAPLQATTYGTGQLLASALANGVRRMIVGMGGSATTDGGAGALQALGVRFLDADGNDLPYGGGSLSRLARIDASGLDVRWRDVEVIIACDVDNPVVGERGAAAVFAPQKGAGSDEVQALEAALDHFFRLVAAEIGVDVRGLEGAGAAGGLAGGIMAFLGGRIEAGIDFILEQMRFGERLECAHLVITGEGQMDDQTLHGKGPIGVARMAAAKGVPTVALVGGLRVNDARLRDMGLLTAIPILPYLMPLTEALAQAGVYMESTAERLGHLLHLGARLAGYGKTNDDFRTFVDGGFDV